MAGDRQTDFVVRVGGDGTPVIEAIDKIRTAVTSAVKDLERQTRNVELFKDTRARVDEATSSLSKLTAEAQKFRDEAAKIESSGGKIGKDLAANLKAAETQVARATKELDKQTASLGRLEGKLTKAGVDTGRLADEEVRLAAATKDAVKQQELLNARQLLGVKSSKEIADQVAKLGAAYQTLKASGAPVNELALAQRNLSKEIADLRKEGGSLGQTFLSFRGAALGAAAAFAGVTAAAKEAVEAAIQYEKQIALIGTVSNLSAEQLGTLGEEVRRTAASLGVDLQDALKATYDLLRQGIPAGNVIDFLKTADEIADTGLADFNQGIKLSSLLVRAFGIEANDLRPTLDGLVNSAKNGGATLGEFADNIGDIAPLARATRTSIFEIEAAIEQMVKAGLDAPAAFNTVQQLLAKLASPDTVAKLRSLGVEVDGLVGTFEQLKAKGIPIGDLIELGVTSARSAPGVAALARETDAAAAAVERMGAASGELQKTGDVLNRLQSKAVEQLLVSLKDLVVTIGQVIAPSTDLINALSSIVQLVTTLTAETKKATSGPLAALGDGFRSFTGLLNPLSLLKAAILGVGEGARRANEAMRQTADVATQTAAAVTDAETSIAKATTEQTLASQQRLAALTVTLTTLLPVLNDASKALVGIGSDAIAAINAEADAQLAALSRLEVSEQERIARITSIQSDAASARLAVIKQAADAALAAEQVAADARLALAKKSADEIAKVELDNAKNKREVLKSITQSYEQHLKGLLQLEADHLGKVKALDQRRVDFNADVEQRIRQIRRSQLTEYQQYQDKIKEIDENIAKSRDELAKGNFAEAEKFAKKAIELTNGIESEVKDGGQVVVTALEAQDLAIKKIQQSQQLVNDAIDGQQIAETNAAKAARQSREDTEKHLALVKSELADITKVVEDGINVKVEIDAKTAVDAARAEIMTLEGLTTHGKHVIDVVRTEGNAAGGVVGEGLRAARRRSPVQRFADGGAVFPRPTWTKVPGFGSGDTVPAALQAGSFVVKKAASRYYGDGLMSAVARFAAGGPVSPLLGGPGSNSKLTGKPGGTLANLGNGGELFDLISAAFRIFTPLIDKAKTLPRSTTGQNLADYLAAVLDLIRNAEDIQAAATLLDGVASISGNLMASIDTAHKFNVPIVMGALAPNEQEGVFKNTPASDLYEALVDTLRNGGGFQQGTAGRFAAGGFARGSDTVPAMLTPGEFVIRKGAVDRLGTGILHAINGMRLSREQVASIARGPIPPQRPRYFADGGPVAAGGTTAPAAPAPVASSSNIDVQVHASADAILSRENVDRILIPRLKDAVRRGAFKV